MLQGFEKEKQREIEGVETATKRHPPRKDLVVCVFFCVFIWFSGSGTQKTSQISEAMEDERGSSLLPSDKENPGYITRDGAELRNFRSYLRWFYVDQSNLCKAGLSWSVFFTLSYVIPIASHFLLDCPNTCDADHSRPYHIPVQISLSVFATLSFLSLSLFDRKYGLSKFLFLDKVSDESLKIQRGYAEKMRVCSFYSFLSLFTRSIWYFGIRYINIC